MSLVFDDRRKKFDLKLSYHGTEFQIKVWKALKDEGLKSRLILQVHDELIVECPQEEAQQVMQIVTNEMEHAAALRVPLVAEAKQGESWYAAK